MAILSLVCTHRGDRGVYFQLFLLSSSPRISIDWAFLFLDPGRSL